MLKLTVSTVETSQQRGERLEVLGNTKEERLRRKQNYDEQRATRGPKQTKPKQQVEQLEVLSKTKQDLRSKSNV